jgi:hypothetical protein
MITVPPKSLELALSHIRSGKRLVIPTYTKVTVIDLKCLNRFEKSGQWLLKEEGDGYRLRRGKSSDYLFPGQLKFVD